MNTALKRVERKLKQLDELFPTETKIDWKPQPGAQSLAFHSPADELFYGGQPGGGKTDLILGLALTQHDRSLILRRRALDLAAIKVRFTEITGKVPANETRINQLYIQLGGCKDEGSKYKFQGQAHDLKAFDEVNQFLESQYTYIKTWNRTAKPGQRCRTVCSFNPPTSPEQRWIIDYLSPWLNPKHPKPAASGEIRYYIGKDEVSSPEPQQGILPIARCFILSSTADNPLLMATGYDRILANLPPELRALTDFGSSMQDDPYQVIPTKWVEDAQERWKLAAEKGEFHIFGDQVQCSIPQDAIAGDPSRGGGDESAFASRHGSLVFCWSYPGAEIKDGVICAEKLLNHRQGSSSILLDALSVGASPFDILKLWGHEPIGLIFSNTSHLRTRCGKFGFANKRAEMMWKLREALDPAYNPTLALPPDPKVLGDLTAPRWSLTFNGILIESKDSIRHRLGRSTNHGDAIMMVCNLGTLQYSSAF
jgi:hypothetical protein